MSQITCYVLLINVIYYIYINFYANTNIFIGEFVSPRVEAKHYLTGIQYGREVICPIWSHGSVHTKPGRALILPNT